MSARRPKSARAAAPAARAPRRRSPSFSLHAPPDAAEPAAFRNAALVLIAVFALVLAWVAFGLHVVGDYSTESDFYGGYADGARLIQHGHLDPARYPVVGPGYEVVLALVGFVIPHPFTAARLISTICAVGTLLLWWLILVRRAGAATAFGSIAFLAINAVFFRYAWSATTDLLAVGLQAASCYFLLASERRAAPLLAGLIAAFATLTRYNYAFLVPAAVACTVWLAPPADGRRARAVLQYLAGFALLAGPWFGWSLATGHMPGASLFAQFGSFYTVDDATRNVQDQLPAVAESLAAVRAATSQVSAGPVGVVLRVLGGIPDHLRRDAFELLGWPTAFAAVAGLVLCVMDGTWRRLAPVGAVGAFAFATLVPVFYSDRYSLAVAPAYTTLAAAAFTSRLVALRVSPPGLHLKWLVALLPIALTVLVGVRDQRRLLGNQPVEVLGTARSLAAASRPGDLLISRKGHVGHYAGRVTVPFPRFQDLRELADYAREKRARFLYYSWYEANVRPEFAFLLDTTAVVPGLTRIHSENRLPAVLFRIDDGFGATPDWLANRDLVRVHLSRAFVRYADAPRVRASREFLAQWAVEQGDLPSAFEQLSALSGLGPLSAAGWRITGHAQRLSGRASIAANDYRRALELDPGDFEARLGLGWALYGLGDLRGAATTWRSEVGPRSDSTTLGAMVDAFTRVGDTAAAQAARRELDRQRAEP